VAVYPLGPSKVDNLILAKEFWPVDERDPLVAYKTMNYWARRRAFEQAQAQGADEALSVGFKGQIWEAARSSLFLVRNQQIIAPQEHGSRLRSVSEAALVDLLCTQHTLKLVYQEISPDQLAIADEVILTNAVRGLMSVGQWHNCQYPSPGPVASELRKLWQANYF
jgi:branched-chain amino acid aminotransferase/4-amino-4-deoxychorismate lyase